MRVYPASAPPLVIHDKNGTPHNVAGWIAVPCWSRDKLQTLQFIPPENGIQKLNLPKAQFNDGFFTVGDITDRAYIVEGIGQAWAVNQATGCAAVVFFGSGRMATVAKTLRTQHPAARLVVVPDKGKEEQAVKLSLPNGEGITAQGVAIVQAVANSTIAPGQGAALLTGLGALARIKEIDELERRITQLERVKNGNA